MSAAKLIAYYRVSTDKQGESGLGLDAQRASVEAYRASNGGQLIRTFTEVESGKRNDRPEVGKALAHARRTGATVVIAKLDRLTRNARFLLEVVESGADVAFCELPQIPPGPMGKFFLTLMAAVAELEAGLISDRTRKALAQARARGKLLGARNPRCKRLTPEASAVGRARSAEVRRQNAERKLADLADEIRELRGTGMLSLRQIADHLNTMGHTTPRGKSWTPAQVKRVLDRPAGNGNGRA